MKSAELFATRVLKTRKISAQRLLKEKNSSADAQFIPPKIGGRDFGHFEVKRKNPYYEVILD